MGKQHPHGGGERLIVTSTPSSATRSASTPIRAEYPEYFAPLPRRGSSSSSIVSMHSERSSSESKDEGQLRYWTSDMCSRSPHFRFCRDGQPTSIPTHTNHVNIYVPLLSSSAVTAPSSSRPGSFSESANRAPCATLCAGFPGLPHKLRLQ